jgi:hypothetical protein
MSSSIDIIRMIKSVGMRRYGNVKLWTEFWLGKPYGKGPPGKPRLTGMWEVGIKMVVREASLEHVNWTELAQVKVK